VRHRANRFGRLPIIVLSTYLSACVSWQAQTVSPAQALSDPLNGNKTFRLETGESGRVEMTHPTVNGDSVTGRHGSDFMTLPLAGIRGTAIKRANTTGTVLLVGGGVVGVGAAVLAYFANRLANAD
jgi:hypothetical protein